MSVNNVIARLYDAGPMKVAEEVSEPDGSFADSIEKAIGERTEKSCSCCGCKEPEKAPADVAVTAGAAEQPGGGPVMFRFKAFISIRSELSGLGDSLAQNFRLATEKYTKTACKGSECGISNLDKYLAKATSVSKSQDGAKSFMDEILKASEEAMKAITASMSGFSLSGGLMGSSGGLTGVSAVDIGRIRMQNAVNPMNPSAIAARVDYGAGRQLEKIGANGESGGLAIVENNGSETEDQASVEAQDQILDRFLQLIDSLEDSTGRQKVVKAEFSFSYNGIDFLNGMRPGKAIGAIENTESDIPENETVTQGTEEVII